MPSYLRDETTVAQLLNAWGLEYKPAPGRRPMPADAVVWVSSVDFGRCMLSAAVRVVEDPRPYEDRRAGETLPRVAATLATGYVDSAVFCPGCGDVIRHRRELMTDPAALMR